MPTMKKIQPKSQMLEVNIIIPHENRMKPDKKEQIKPIISSLFFSGIFLTVNVDILI
ncbi:hypothetical protein LCGC14_0949550 [marine sediment metagenome]|uniref:Uncharacterized protein n=1 Tax=marine sediment metagenome TaxID=412755 RepID=A0A0F9NHS4_9ZZZZ